MNKPPEKETDMGALPLANEPLNINELAREALAKHADYDMATAELVRRYKTDPVLRAQTEESAIRAYFRGVVYAVASDGRAVSSGIGGTKVRPVAVSPSVVSLADWGGAVAAGMMDVFRLGAKPLGDATKGDLLTRSAGYATTANDSMIKARWLGMIADAMPNSTATVREALTEEKITEMRDAARANPWGE